MNNKPPIFKVAAVLSSVVLAGTYVWYRSGGNLPFLSAPVAAEAKDDVRTPPGVESDFQAEPKSSETQAPQIDPEVAREILLSGSKSEPIRPAQPAPQRNPARKFLPGSKSGGFEFDEPPAPPPAVSPPPAQKVERVLMPGSKSERIMPVQPQPAPRAPSQQAPPPRQTRTILPGSKSMRIDIQRPAQQSHSAEQGARP